MTEARLNEIARNTPRTFDGIKSAILTACEAESKLVTAEQAGISYKEERDHYRQEMYRFSTLACQRDQAVAAAMVEKCADVAYAHKATMLGPSTNKLLNDFGLEISIKIRSLCPVGVLDELLFKAKGEALDAACWDEALRKARLEVERDLLENLLVNVMKHFETVEEVTDYLRGMQACCLVALRATPQPTAVKENANG